MRKLLALIEVAGGLLILAAFLFLSGVLVGHFNFNLKSQGVTEWSWPIILSLLIPVLFGILVLGAGVNLWRNKKSGYILSIIAQLVQLIIVQSPHFYYVFFTLVNLSISFSKLGVLTNYGLGTSFLISARPQPVSALFIGINLVALVLLIWTICLYRRFLKSSS